MRITVVLDTSAVVAYARGSVAVGELLMMVGEDGDQVGVPVTCLAEAYSVTKVDDRAALRYLSAGLPAVTVLPLELSDAQRVGGLARQSSIGCGHAVATTVRTNAYIATFEGDTIRNLAGPGSPVIDLS